MTFLFIFPCASPLEALGLIIALCVLASMSVYYFFEDEKPYNGFALYGKLEGELWNSKAKERWRKSANKILQSAITEVRHHCKKFSLDPTLTS